MRNPFRHAPRQPSSPERRTFPIAASYRHGPLEAVYSAELSKRGGTLWKSRKVVSLGTLRDIDFLGTYELKYFGVDKARRGELFGIIDLIHYRKSGNFAAVTTPDLQGGTIEETNISGPTPQLAINEGIVPPLNPHPRNHGGALYAERRLL